MQWTKMCIVCPYAVRQLKKNVRKLQLKWADDGYLRRMIFAVFTCEKCHVYFDTLVTFLFKYNMKWKSMYFVIMLKMSVRS